jgi:hypothetical protein
MSYWLPPRIHGRVDREVTHTGPSMASESITPNTPSKEKGDLLERFAENFLRTQNYEVETQVRVTAAELDLLCKHRVNGRTLYVECKAHRDPLSSNELKNLLGTIILKNYDEGWLISTGVLGKDAKGFQHEWEQKPIQERQKLSIYTPDRIIDAFAAAGLITLPPDVKHGGKVPCAIHAARPVAAAQQPPVSGSQNRWRPASAVSGY